ncbi:MAG: hypothetical protein P8J14_08785 [Emcibacteraceae bacterium]|nr:hypothetical protein [Emcibacteraceae bacterium]
MTFSIDQLSRRQFNKAAVMFIAASSFSGSHIAFADNRDTADGLIHLGLNGKITFYSGIAHQNPYSRVDTIEPIKKTLGCFDSDLITNVGNNPLQLPGMLGQHCNHLSFTSSKTNQKAADVLKSELITRMQNLSGFKDSTFQLKSGLVKTHGRDIPLDEILPKSNTLIEVGRVCLKTKKIANTINHNGITIMVSEVI